MRFNLLRKIDQGEFASIYKIEDQNGKEYAFKAVPANKLKYIELDILSRLKSPYLIRTIDPKIVSFEGKYGIIEELKDDNLANLNVKDLAYIQLKRIIISSIYGMKCMHTKGYLHLDISRRNILYSKNKEGNYSAFLTDFGWSVRCDDAYKGIISDKVIKYKNVPLEILNPSEKDVRKYSDKSDVWSLGIVILELLGSKFDYKDLDKMKNINDAYIEEKIRLYNKGKTDKNEELYLKELLVNMLKINPEERISSKDITNLKFFKNKQRILNLTQDCVLEKPKEMVFMPYTSYKTQAGIKKINQYYLDSSSKDVNIVIDEYFLAIQVYLRLMSKCPPDCTDSEYEDFINESIEIAKNYYDRSFDNASYKYAKELEDQVGYNFYYFAEYLEDIVILNHFLLTGQKDLLSFYNLFDIKKLFEYFRENYEYNYIKRNAYSLNDFLKFSLPKKKDRTEVDFLSALDYYENIRSDYDDSLVRNYKEYEIEFRKDIIDHFSEDIIRSFKDKDSTIIDKITQDKNLLNEYSDFKRNLVNTNIVKKLKNINPYFDYGYLDSSSIDVKDFNKEYYIVKKYNKYSLLRIEGKEAVHYYSDLDKELKDYLEIRDYKYINNFNYGINSCCKIIEFCLIYIVYYNLKTGKKDYHFKCFDESTIKSLMLVLMI